MDFGCTTNISSGHAYDRPSPYYKERLEARQTMAMASNGTHLTYDLIAFQLSLKRVCLKEVLMVGRFKKDVSLGMSFLLERHFNMTLGMLMISIEGRVIHCTNRHGRQLTSDLQVVQ